jgi:hypothetical protein
MYSVLMVDDNYFWVNFMRSLIDEVLPTHLYRFDHCDNLKDAITWIDAIDRSTPCLLLLDNLIPSALDPADHIENGSERILAYIGPVPPHWRVLVMSVSWWLQAESHAGDPRIIGVDKGTSVDEIKKTLTSLLGIAT